MAVYRIPFTGIPQKMTTLLGTSYYQLEVFYAPAANGEGGWCLNINNSFGARLLSSIPLVTGQDLLEPYPGLGIDCVLWCATSGAPAETPTETNFGQPGGGNVFWGDPDVKPIVIPDTVTLVDATPLAVLPPATPPADDPYLGGGGGEIPVFDPGGAPVGL